MIDTVSSIAIARPREVATVAGRVASIEVQPHDASPSLSVHIGDGTGVVEAIFLGRRDIPGLTPGAHVTVSGRLNDAAQLFNPRFELG